MGEDLACMYVLPSELPVAVMMNGHVSECWVLLREGR